MRSQVAWQLWDYYYSLVFFLSIQPYNQTHLKLPVLFPFLPEPVPDALVCLRKYSHNAIALLIEIETDLLFQRHGFGKYTLLQMRTLVFL
jgi:hypothetical protein